MNRKITLAFLLNFILLTGASLTSWAQQNYFYDFKNNLNEVSGSGPALTVLGTGSFVNESLGELSCIVRPVYGFTQNSGVQFNNTAAGNFIGTSYSIEMYFKFLIDGTFKRIIDYKNQSSDSGLYCTPSLLTFYDGLTVNTTAFIANQYVHLVVTRDGATEEVSLFIDGSLGGSFIDTSGIALMDGTNVLNFFQDDLVFGGESRPGRIAILKIYDTVLDSATVSDNYVGLQATSGTLAFSPDIAASCLAGNSFSFTNESVNNGGYAYSWNFGDGNSQAGTNAMHSYLTPGTFDVLLIASGAGCTDTVATQVTVYDAAPVNLGPDVSLCTGDSVTLNAGAGFSSYLWNNGSSNAAITINTSGIYTVDVTDSTGCSGSDTIMVDIVPYPVLNLGSDANICFGQTFTISATPGLASYLWSTGDTTETIDVTASGSYWVEVANVAGCSVTDTLTLSVNPEIIFSIGADTSFCEGNTLTLDAGSFQAYLWSDGTSLQTIDVTITGTYSVTVTDLFGCTAVENISIVVNAIPIVNLGADTTFCGGTPVVLDPGPQYIGYLWNTGSQNPTLSVTSGGTYAVMVTDINGCTATDSISLIATPLIDLGPDLNLCNGLATILDAGPGLSSYLWNDGSALQTLNVNTSGTYSVTVTDNSGCVNQDVIVVSFYAIPQIDLGNDFDICDGQIGILDPGAGFSSYLWSDGSTDPVLFVTAAGTYAVTVSSAANCSAIDSITISVLPIPVIDLGTDSTLCDGLTLVLDAGAGFSSYLWTDGSSNQTLDVTVSGTYDVTITGANGCENADSIIVIFEGPPFLELGPDQQICSGTATVLDAGSGMATYLWNDGSNSQLLLVFSNGTYAVTITSFAGCTSQDSVSVTLLSSPVVSLGADTILCDGTQLIIDAGAGFSSYLWSDGSFAQTYTVTTAGIYTVVVTDGSNCNGIDDIEVMYYAPVPVPVITLNVNTLQSSPAASYQWYSVPGGLIAGATSQDYSPGQDGTYYVVVTDSNGCTSLPSADFIFVLDGLQSVNGFTVSMSPNPANDMVTISLAALTGKTYRLELMDMPGKTVFVNEAIPVGNYNLNVSTFVEGVYIIKLSNDSYQVTRRLVISR